MSCDIGHLFRIQKANPRKDIASTSFEVGPFFIPPASAVGTGKVIAAGALIESDALDFMVKEASFRKRQAYSLSPDLVKPP